VNIFYSVECNISFLLRSNNNNHYCGGESQFKKKLDGKRKIGLLMEH
jgi:hypothetical protein